MKPITILTPVYLDRPERLEYLHTTLTSFYQCCQYSGPYLHLLVDDRSPMCAGELTALCKQFNIQFLGKTDPTKRQGFFEVYRWLVSSVETEFFLYLEPDHYFYLPCDFL